MKKPKLIYVKWEDPYGNSSFRGTQEEAVKWAEGSRCLVEQVGWLVYETEKYIALAEDFTDFKDDSHVSFRTLTKIMMSLIRKRRMVKI